MRFTADQLLAWAGRHESDAWVSLGRSLPFRYHVNRSGIEYVPASGHPRNVPRSELASFCDEFSETRSFAPGKYPTRWHKSYTLPLIKRFLSELRQAGGDAPIRS
jgi:hypothetical protein